MNTGLSANVVKIKFADAIRDGIIEDIQDPRKYNRKTNESSHA
jgi:hypothetical protein